MYEENSLMKEEGHSFVRFGHIFFLTGSTTLSVFDPCTYTKLGTWVYGRTRNILFETQTDVSTGGASTPTYVVPLFS